MRPLFGFLFAFLLRLCCALTDDDGAPVDEETSAQCGSDGFDASRFTRRRHHFDLSAAGFVVGVLPRSAVDVLLDVQHAVSACLTTRGRCGAEQSVAQLRQPAPVRAALFGSVNYQTLRCFIDSDACREYAREPAILDAVRRALGNDVVLLLVEPIQLAVENARPWHTDVEAYDRCVGKIVQVWLPTDGVGATATLSVMSHSHTMPSYSAIHSAALHSAGDVQRCAAAFDPRARIVTPVTRLGQFLLASPHLWRRFDSVSAHVKSLRLTFATPDCEAVATANREPSQVLIPIRPPVLLVTGNVQRDTHRIVNNMLLVDRQDTFFDWPRVDSLATLAREHWANGVTVETVHLADANTVSRPFDGGTSLTVLVVTHGRGRLFHRHTSDLNGELMELTPGGIFAVFGGAFMLSSGESNTSFIRLTVPFAFTRRPPMPDLPEFQAWPVNASLLWKSTEWTLMSRLCRTVSNAAAVVTREPLRAIAAPPASGQCVALYETKKMPVVPTHLPHRPNATAASHAPRLPLLSIPAKAFPAALMRNVSLASRSNLRAQRLTLAEGTTAMHTAGMSITLGGLAPRYRPYTLRAHPLDEIRVVLRGRIEVSYHDRSELLTANESQVSVSFAPAGSRHSIASLDEQVKFLMYKWRARSEVRASCTDNQRTVDVALTDSNQELATVCSRYVAGAVRLRYVTLRPADAVPPRNLTHEISLLLLDGQLHVGAGHVIRALPGSSVGVLHQQPGESHSLLNIGRTVARFLLFELNVRDT